ncbi:MAG: helix-turn-helix domain-containing protein [Phenylobacterium sp.]|uniref:helix-turn-helix domain-containing protein n=1 Tax=Phenylobacterium sp. TaxID=1871053 RepID=UPI00391A0306
MADNDRSDPIDVAVGSRIRVRRQALKISQSALAEALGLSFQQIQKYERGANRVSASMLVKIARKLECSAAALLGETEGHAGDEEFLQLLSTPGAVDLLAAFSRISDAATRSAVISVARGLATNGTRCTA